MYATPGSRNVKNPLAPAFARILSLRHSFLSGFRAVLTIMQKPMRNLQCHAMALFAPGGAIAMGIASLHGNSPVDSGVVMTS